MDEPAVLTRDRALELREQHMPIMEIAELYKLSPAAVETLLESPHE